MKTALVPLFAAALAAGCAAARMPENPQNAAAGEAYQAQYRAADEDRRDLERDRREEDRDAVARRSVAHVDADGLVVTVPPP